MKKKDIKDVELFLFDLDGTVYIGDKEIDGAFDAINTLRKMGKRICFFTNNSSRMHTDYISRLNNLGLRVYSDEIYTSGQVTCEYILDKYRGKKVYLLGNERLKSEFDLYGIEVVDEDPLVDLRLECSRLGQTPEVFSFDGDFDIVTCNLSKDCLKIDSLNTGSGNGKDILVSDAVIFSITFLAGISDRKSHT